MPKAAGPTCFDQRSDVLQIGLVALALIHGRSLNLEEYPVPVASLSERAWAATASGGLEPLPAALRTWLNRTLQLEPKQAFNTATAVWSDLKHALPQGSAGELQALKSALARYGFDSLPALPTPAKGTSIPAAPARAPIVTPRPAEPVTPAPIAKPVTPAPIAKPVTPAPVAQPVTPAPAAARAMTPPVTTPVRTPVRRRSVAASDTGSDSASHASAERRGGTAHAVADRRRTARRLADADAGETAAGARDREVCGAKIRAR